MSRFAFAQTIKSYFGVEQVRMLSSDLGTPSTISAMAIRSTTPKVWSPSGIEVEHAYSLSVHRTEMTEQSLGTAHPGGRTQRLGMNALCSLQVHRLPNGAFHSPFSFVMFHVPHSSLIRTARKHFRKTLGKIELPEMGVRDDKIVHLADILYPLLQDGTQDQLLVDNVLETLQNHLLERYANLHHRFRTKEMLTPRQLNRAKDVMVSGLGEKVSLSVVARECGVSVSHFTRAFRHATGRPPYRWLQEQRMERAKRLLSDTSLTMTAIALECGFMHRVPFTNAFHRLIGITPGNWRQLA